MHLHKRKGNEGFLPYTAPVSVAGAFLRMFNFVDSDEFLCDNIYRKWKGGGSNGP